MSEQDFFKGIETAARWHDQQAVHYRNFAARIRKFPVPPDADRREYQKLAQDQDAESWRHDHNAKMIRALADQRFGQ